MTSKKPASSKRASPPRTCDYTKVFRKDWERLSRSGRYVLKRLKEAMLLLVANEEPLGTEPARRRWNAIPADIRQRLLANVWCAHCSRETTITDVAGSVHRGPTGNATL